MNRKQKPRRITMTEVAKAAGVSQTTVSFVLNDIRTVNISEETRQKVIEAARRLGYSSNLAIKNSLLNRSRSIGFITDEIGISSYGGEALKGAQEAAWAQENMLFLINTEGIREMEEAAVAAMCERQVDGIVLATMIRREIQLTEKSCDIPMVAMNAYCADGSIPAFTTDEVWGGREATSILLRSGHRRIAFINGEQWMDAAMERLQGYQEALAAYDVDYDERLVCFGNWRPDSGYEHALELLQKPEPPTAIFCGNDLIAQGVFEAAKELGLSIPEGLSVVGYDDQEIASYLHPSLTTIRLPYYEMGYKSVSHLLKLIGKKPGPTPKQEKMLGTIVVRESVAQVPET